MASSSQVFPSRSYTTGLHSTSKLPDRSTQPQGGFGASHTHAAREAARLERERQERERQAQLLLQQQQQGGSSGAMTNLTDEQKNEINEAFSLFDLDKDSRIDYHEFKVSLKALGFDLPKPDLLNLLTTNGVPPLSWVAQNPSYTAPNPNQPIPQQQQQQQACPPNRLQLTLPAFQSIAAELIAARDPRDEILRAFALFDTEGKGMITLEDLRRVARELNEGLDDEELVAMIEEFDLEGKGGVGAEEFVGICMG